MRRRTRGLVGIVVAVAAALLVPASASADWVTYGYSVSRSGLNPFEKALSPTSVKSLKQRWSTSVGGFINTQPVLASDVRRGSQRLKVVYVGSESGRFAAVNAVTGRVLWRRKLGSVSTRCGDLPSYGITGTPQINRSRRSIFVVSKGKAYELSLATGKTKHKWTISADPKHNHNWSALTISHGILYVALAGICDTEPYKGQIVATRVKTRKRVARWFVTGAKGPFGGGIWSFGGLSADSGGNIYVATGDAAGPKQHSHYAEHVVRLSPHLKVRSSNYPGVSGRDADFGATPLLYRAPGCPSQLAVGNKFGSFFVYNRSRIGRGPVQRIRLGGSIDGQRALVGVAAYWPERRMVYVSNPRPSGKYRPGIVAFRVTSKCRLAKVWNNRGPWNLTSSPTVANGVVYYGTGLHHTVVALDGRNGRRLKTLKVGKAIFGAPTVIGGFVYAGSWDGRLRAFSSRP